MLGNTAPGCPKRVVEEVEGALQMDCSLTLSLNRYDRRNSVSEGTVVLSRVQSYSIVSVNPCARGGDLKVCAVAFNMPTKPYR